MDGNNLPKAVNQQTSNTAPSQSSTDQPGATTTPTVPVATMTDTADQLNVSEGVEVNEAKPSQPAVTAYKFVRYCYKQPRKIFADEKKEEASEKLIAEELKKKELALKKEADAQRKEAEKAQKKQAKVQMKEAEKQRKEAEKAQKKRAKVQMKEAEKQRKPAKAAEKKMIVAEKKAKDMSHKEKPMSTGRVRVTSDKLNVAGPFSALPPVSDNQPLSELTHALASSTSVQSPATSTFDEARPTVGESDLSGMDHGAGASNSEAVTQRRQQVHKQRKDKPKSRSKSQMQTGLTTIEETSETSEEIMTTDSASKEPSSAATQRNSVPLSEASTTILPPNESHQSASTPVVHAPVSLSISSALSNALRLSENQSGASGTAVVTSSSVVEIDGIIEAGQELESTGLSSAIYEQSRTPPVVKEIKTNSQPVTAPTTVIDDKTTSTSRILKPVVAISSAPAVRNSDSSRFQPSKATVPLKRTAKRPLPKEASDKTESGCVSRNRLQALLVTTVQRDSESTDSTLTALASEAVFDSNSSVVSLSSTEHGITVPAIASSADVVKTNGSSEAIRKMAKPAISVKSSKVENSRPKIFRDPAKQCLRKQELENSLTSVNYSPAVQQVDVIPTADEPAEKRHRAGNIVDQVETMKRSDGKELWPSDQEDAEKQLKELQQKQKIERRENSPRKVLITEEKHRELKRKSELYERLMAEKTIDNQNTAASRNAGNKAMKVKEAETAKVAKRTRKELLAEVEREEKKNEHLAKVNNTLEEMKTKMEKYQTMYYDQRRKECEAAMALKEMDRILKTTCQVVNQSSINGNNATQEMVHLMREALANAKNFADICQNQLNGDGESEVTDRNADGNTPGPSNSRPVINDMEDNFSHSEVNDGLEDVEMEDVDEDATLLTVDQKETEEIGDEAMAFQSKQTISASTVTSKAELTTKQRPVEPINSGAAELLESLVVSNAVNHQSSMTAPDNTTSTEPRVLETVKVAHSSQPPQPIQPSETQDEQRISKTAPVVRQQRQGNLNARKTSSPKPNSLTMDSDEKADDRSVRSTSTSTPTTSRHPRNHHACPTPMDRKQADNVLLVASRKRPRSDEKGCDAKLGKTVTVGGEKKIHWYTLKCLGSNLWNNLKKLTKEQKQNIIEICGSVKETGLSKEVHEFKNDDYGANVRILRCVLRFCKTRLGKVEASVGRGRGGEENDNEEGGEKMGEQDEKEQNKENKKRENRNKKSEQKDSGENPVYNSDRFQNTSSIIGPEAKPPTFMKNMGLENTKVKSEKVDSEPLPILVVDIEDKNIKKKATSGSVCIIRNVLGLIDVDAFSVDELQKLHKNNPDDIQIMRQRPQSTTENEGLRKKGLEDFHMDYTQEKHPTAAVLENYAQVKEIGRRGYNRCTKTFPIQEDDLLQMQRKLKAAQLEGETVKKSDVPFALIAFGSNIDVDNSTKQMEAIKKLPSFTLPNGHLMRLLAEKIPGINQIQVYLKGPGCRTVPHHENQGIGSINVNLGPDDCIWFTVSTNYAADLERLLCQKNCFPYHTKTWPSEQELKKANIPYTKFVQKAGDMVVINTGTYHWVQSDGFCTNIAWNILLDDPMQLAAAAMFNDHNATQKNATALPLEKLLWKCAEDKMKPGSEFSRLIKSLLISSLARCQMEFDAAAARGWTIHKVEEDKDVKDAKICFGEGCHRNTSFNMFFVGDDPEQRLPFCINCVTNPGKNKSVKCFYWKSIEELVKIFNDYQ